MLRGKPNQPPTYRALVHVDLAVSEVGQLLEGVNRNQHRTNVGLLVFKIRVEKQDEGR